MVLTDIALFDSCYLMPNSKKSKARDEHPPTPVYAEIPNITALPDPSLHLQYNTAYGMAPPQQMELTDNVSYGVIQ